MQRHGEQECWTKLLLSAARTAALKSGLAWDTAEDCSAEFVAQMLLRGPAMLREDPRQPAARAWARRCAANYVISFGRAKARLNGRELLLHEIEEIGAVAAAAEAICFRNYFWQSVESALGSLSGDAQQLLIRHYFMEQSVGDLAAET